jgi:hypothetical protein
MKRSTNLSVEMMDWQRMKVRVTNLDLSKNLERVTVTEMTKVTNLNSVIKTVIQKMKEKANCSEKVTEIRNSMG